MNGAIFMSMLLSLPVQTIAPSFTPVHLNEVKRPLRLTECDPDQDAEVERYIQTATEQLESDTLRQFVAATFELKMPDFPYGRQYGFIRDGDILLPRVPLLSFDSLTYFDTTNASQTVTSADYFVHKERYPPRVQVDRDGGEYWPQVYERHDAVTATFKAGHVVPLTPDASSNNFTSTGYTYTNGDSFRISVNGGVVPDGFDQKTTYFVVGESGNTFQLSATSGGTAKTFTTNGSGYLFAGTVPLLARQAIVTLVKAWYCGECGMDCTTSTYESLMRRLRWEVVV